jgi:hypothetical protein
LARGTFKRHIHIKIAKAFCEKRCQVSGINVSDRD